MVRVGLVALVRGTSRSRRLDPLARGADVVATRRALRGGWGLRCVRHGRLAGSTTSPRGADPMPYIEALRASAEVVAPALPPATAATAEESEKILRWLESPGVRIVDIDGVWTCPVGGAALSLIHISEPTRPHSISYAVFCLQKHPNNLNSATPP